MGSLGESDLELLTPNPKGAAAESLTKIIVRVSAPEDQHLVHIGWRKVGNRQHLSSNCKARARKAYSIERTWRI